MKQKCKKMISMILTICIIAAMMPQVALAEEVPLTKEVQVAGITLNEKTPYLINGTAQAVSALDGIEDGYTYLDTGTGTLELHCAVIQSSGTDYTDYAVYNVDNSKKMTLKVCGDSTISSAGGNVIYSAGQSSGGYPLLITGEGNLKITGNSRSSMGIVCGNGIEIDKYKGDISVLSQMSCISCALKGSSFSAVNFAGNLELNTDYKGNAIYCSGDVKLNMDGNFTAKSMSSGDAVRSYGAVSIETTGDLSITAQGNDNSAVAASGAVSLMAGGDIWVLGRKYSLCSSNKPIYVETTKGSFQIAGGDVGWTTTDSLNEECSLTIKAKKDINMYGATAYQAELNAEGGVSVNRNLLVTDHAAIKAPGGMRTGRNTSIQGSVEEIPATLSISGLIPKDSVFSTKNMNIVVPSGETLDNQGMIKKSAGTSFTAEGTVSGQVALNDIYDTGVIFTTSDVEKKIYAVNSGTLTWDPVVEGGQVTRAVISLDKAVFNWSINGSAITVPDIPVELVVCGNCELYGSPVSLAGAKSLTIRGAENTENRIVMSGGKGAINVPGSVCVNSGVECCVLTNSDTDYAVTASEMSIAENASVTVEDTTKNGLQLGTGEGDETHEVLSVAGTLNAPCKEKAIALKEGFMKVSGTVNAVTISGAGTMAQCIRTEGAGSVNALYDESEGTQQKYLAMGDATFGASDVTLLPENTYWYTIPDNASLTVQAGYKLNASGLASTKAELLERLAIDGVLTVEGTFVLPEADGIDGAFIKSLGLAGSGLVQAGEMWYTTAGESKVYTDEIEITPDTTAGDGFTFQKNGKGSYTLTLNGIIVNSCISFNEFNYDDLIIIDTKKESIVNKIYGVCEYGSDFILTGDECLTITDDIYCVNLTVDGTTVNMSNTGLHTENLTLKNGAYLTVGEAVGCDGVLSMEESCVLRAQVKNSGYYSAFYILNTDSADAYLPGGYAWMKSKDSNTSNTKDYYVPYLISNENAYVQDITFRKLGVSDFTFTAPSNAVYDGQPKTAEVTIKTAGLSENVVVKYYKNGVLLSGAPVNAGTYTVKIDATGDYAVTDLTASDWTFTIARAVTEEVIATPAVENADDSSTLKLSDITLPTGWQWVNADTKPATGTHTYPAFYTVEDSNYDYSAIEGYDATNHRVVREVSLTVNASGDSGNTPDPSDEYLEQRISISGASIGKIKSVTYTGGEQKPAVTVKVKGKVLEQDADYTVTYRNNVNAGTAEVSITGKGDYKDSISGSFVILPKKLTAKLVDCKNQNATGTELNPRLTLTDNGRALVLNSDYQVTKVINNVQPGTATYFLAGMGNYKGTLKGTFKIYEEGVSMLSDCTAEIDSSVAPQGGVVYTGRAFKPAVVVKDVSGNEVPSSNYTVSYQNNKNAGTALITMKAKGKTYKGTLTAHFTILPQTIEGVYEMQNIKNGVFTGSIVKQTPIIRLIGGKAKLKANRDYVIAYTDAVNTSEQAKVTVTGCGNYSGTLTTTFMITRKDISKKIKVATIKKQNYTGLEIKPELKVTYGKRTLLEGRDYTLAFANNVEKGKATVTLTGIGNYEGNLPKTFRIK